MNEVDKENPWIRPAAQIGPGIIFGDKDANTVDVTDRVIELSKLHQLERIADSLEKIVTEFDKINMTQYDRLVKEVQG